MKIEYNKPKSAWNVFVRTVIITTCALLLIAIGYFAAAFFSGALG